VSAVPVPALRYRAMQPADLGAVSALEQSVYPFPWSLGNFRDCLQAGYDCWVATHGSELIAYAVLMVAMDEAHLLNIAVSSANQRQGIGRAFLDHIIGVARDRGAQIVYLEVRPSNHAARELYREAGFQQIAIRPAYYPAHRGREDALFLGITL
jgi:ribosomal-protein-alanine N-acetyltransferase